jgi:hypothetical protein
VMEPVSRDVIGHLSQTRVISSRTDPKSLIAT